MGEYYVMSSKSVKSLVKVENVVATGTLEHQIDLEAVSRVLPNGKYNPDQFPGVIYHLTKPKSAGLIFGSGKVVTTGTKSERQAKTAISRIVNELKMNGVVIIGKPDIQVRNVVASIDFGGTIDLEETAFTLERTVYDPEQFPGLIYRMDKPSLTFLIFANGKIICAGAKSEKDLYEGIKSLERNLMEKELLVKH